MARVPAGGRLVLRSGAGVVALRALREVELAGRWAVPVLAPARALTAGEGVLEVATDTGLVSAAAHLRVRDGVLEVVPGAGAEPVLRQRRDDVRGRLSLPLRAAAADAAADRILGDAVLEGVTVDVSAGGVSADLHPRSALAPSGARLYVELNLPDGALVPTVVLVVEVRGRRLHGRFVDIAGADRERLVRLVVERQRRDLAARAARRADL